MKKYILKRLGLSIGTLLLIILILFSLMQLMPGSPFNDEKLSPAQQERIRDHYGLNDPIPTQFVRYVGQMVRFDFGSSYNISKDTPVSELLKTRLPVSLGLGGLAILIGSFFGLFLGLYAALRHHRIGDTIATFIAVLGVSIPSYVFALLLMYVFGHKLDWFPMLFNAKLGFISYVLPSVALSVSAMATIARFTRTEMIEVFQQDYMLLLEAKGISRTRLILLHALRNASIPLVTVLGPLVVNLMTGSLVVEKIFSVPGIGQLMINAIQSNDYNIVLSLAFVYSAMYIGIMLIVDILYGILDPRIRLTKEAKND
ncbi:MAG: ABC transporter permease [Eubacteriales bacterium]|nr:ABC transporter permease [Eubacteriales bacterium]